MKIGVELWFLIATHSALYLVYICTKFHENILDRIKVIEGTQFSKEKIQRA